MSRQYKNGKCSCWAAIEKKLEETDDAIDYSFSMDGRVYLQISTFRVRGRGRPQAIVATYCPVCGEKLKQAPPTRTG